MTRFAVTCGAELSEHRMAIYVNGKRPVNDVRNWTKQCVGLFSVSSLLNHIMRCFILPYRRNSTTERHVIYKVILKWCCIKMTEILDFGLGLLVFAISASFLLSDTSQIWGFRRYSSELIGVWLKIWHADVSWPPCQRIPFWWWPVHFGGILT